MNYEEGNVIEKRGLIFKDEYTPDPYGKHPVMIKRRDKYYGLSLAVSEDNQYMYFLTFTSQTDKYFEHPEWRDRYFLLKRTKYNMLKKSSLINLQNIYKEPVSRDYSVAFVQPDEYKKIIRKFRKWQEENPDEFYEEIKTLL